MRGHLDKFLKQLRPGLSMNAAINTASAAHCLAGSIDDHVNILLRHTAVDNCNSRLSDSHLRRVSFKSIS